MNNPTGQTDFASDLSGAEPWVRAEWCRQGYPGALIECALQVGDFGDAINWPTPGEIAHKSVQVSVGKDGQV